MAWDGSIRTRRVHRRRLAVEERVVSDDLLRVDTLQSRQGGKDAANYYAGHCFETCAGQAVDVERRYRTLADCSVTGDVVTTLSLYTRI